MSTTKFNLGDVVFDTEYKEIFRYSNGERMIIDRLRLATEEEKVKLEKSGKECISAE